MCYLRRLPPIFTGKGSRADHDHIVAIFTDGEMSQSQAEEIMAEVDKIRYLNIHYLVIGEFYPIKYTVSIAHLVFVSVNLLKV